MAVLLFQIGHLKRRLATEGSKILYIMFAPPTENLNEWGTHRLQLKVKLADGRSISVNASLGDNVFELKQSILKCWGGGGLGISPSGIKVLMEGRPLFDEWTLVCFN